MGSGIPFIFSTDVCLAAFGRRFWKESDRRVCVGGGGCGGVLWEGCIAWMYILMFDPTKRRTGMKPR